MSVEPTIVSYPGDGVTRIFTFQFDYIKRDYVKARVNANPVPFTFTNAKTIQLETPPAVGDVLVISRETDRNRLVDFVDGSVLISADMNLSALQAIHIVQEATDLSAASLALEQDGSLGASLRRISNLADPEQPRDAVNKQWAETAMSSQLQQATAQRVLSETARAGAEAARDNAQGARNQAQGFRDEAGQSNSAAQAARAAAEAARDNAQGSRNQAQGFRNEAEGFRDVAEFFAYSANDHDASAWSARQQAEGQANRAKNEADRAQDYADSVENPVAYTPQDRSEAQKAQARANLGVDAAGSVGGIPSGQIARRDRGAAFDGNVGAISSVNITAADGGNGNSHVWFRNAAGDQRGLVFRDAATGTMRIRVYSDDNTFEEVRLYSDGGFRAPYFQGDGSRLTNLFFGPEWRAFNVTGQRGNGTTYTNNTPYPMMISGSHNAQNQTAAFQLVVDGVSITHAVDFDRDGPRRVTGSAIVPAGSTYSFSWGSGGSTTLAEIRRQ